MHALKSLHVQVILSNSLTIPGRSERNLIRVTYNIGHVVSEETKEKMLLYWLNTTINFSFLLWCFQTISHIFMVLYFIVFWTDLPARIENT